MLPLAEIYWIDSIVISFTSFYKPSYSGWIFNFPSG